jgi:hypothetical protein
LPTFTLHPPELGVSISLVSERMRFGQKQVPCRDNLAPIDFSGVGRGKEHMQDRGVSSGRESGKSHQRIADDVHIASLVPPTARCGGGNEVWKFLPESTFRRFDVDSVNVMIISAFKFHAMKL